MSAWPRLGTCKMPHVGFLPAGLQLHLTPEPVSPQRNIGKIMRNVLLGWVLCWKAGCPWAHLFDRQYPVDALFCVSIYPRQAIAPSKANVQAVAIRGSGPADKITAPSLNLDLRCERHRALRISCILQWLVGQGLGPLGFCRSRQELQVRPGTEWWKHMRGNARPRSRPLRAMRLLSARNTACSSLLASKPACRDGARGS